jgi:hypothetical protein
MYSMLSSFFGLSSYRIENTASALHCMEYSQLLLIIIETDVARLHCIYLVCSIKQMHVSESKHL